MNNKVFNLNLPEDYFRDKDGIKYRFTILKDIAAAGKEPPIPYDDSHEEYIIGLYKKYRDFALYVHVPWCIEHCSYCHYYRSQMPRRVEMEKLIRAEMKYARMLDDRINLLSKNVRSIYFGGGTPTVLPAVLLDESMGFFVENYSSKEDCEVCCESSVITLKSKKLDILEKYVSRLSIGVQSFNDRILQMIERKHTGAQGEELLKEVVPRFPSVNIDLIYGLYMQTLGEWLSSIETSIRLKVQSITIYRLDIRETPSIFATYRDEPEKFPDEPMCQVMYKEAKNMLEAAGYRENLVGWFLLPQVSDTTVYRERWEKQSPCIAFGPGLHNYAADHFYESLLESEAYITAVETGKLPIQSIYLMDREKQLIWYVLAQWKSNRPVYKSVISRRFGDKLLNWFMGFIPDYITWKVLIVSEDKLEVTEDGHSILEWILLELINQLD